MSETGENSKTPGRPDHETYMAEVSLITTHTMNLVHWIGYTAATQVMVEKDDSSQAFIHFVLHRIAKGRSPHAARQWFHKGQLPDGRRISEVMMSKDIPRDERQALRDSATDAIGQPASSARQALAEAWSRHPRPLDAFSAATARAIAGVMNRHRLQRPPR